MAGESVTALQSFVTPEDKAAFVHLMWTTWDGAKDEAVSQWREVEAYRYATDTNSLPNAKSAFTHSTHIPELATIAEDLEAIMKQVVHPHEDWFTFAPQDTFAARKEQRLAITSYLKNRHLLNGFKTELDKQISDVVTYGNSFVQVAHVNESTENKEGYIGPKSTRISPYDIAFDPTAGSFESTPKIIREVISLGEAFKRAQNGMYDEEAVRDILSNRSSFSSTDAGEDKNEQYVPLGFSTYQQYLTSGFVEVLWFYGDVYDSEGQVLHENRKYVVADNTLLLEEEIKTASGRPHIYQAVWKRLPDNLWGQGPLANIVGINYQINHRENSKSEGLDRTIYPDRVYQGDVEEVYDEELGQVTYHAPEGGGVQDLSINTQFLNADLHIDRLSFAARKSARLPGDITGFRSQGEKTLGEVTALTEGGMRGFVDKAADFEINSLERQLQAEIEIAHDNFGTSLKVPNKADNGFISMLEISKEDLAVNGVLQAKGARRFARKNQLLNNLVQISGSPLVQVAIQHISGKGAANLLAELLEVQDMQLFEEFAQIIESGEAQQIANTVEQQGALQASQPSLEEEILTQQMEGEDG